MPISRPRALIAVLAVGLLAGCGSGATRSTAAPISQPTAAEADTPNWKSYGGIRTSAQQAIKSGLKDAECPLPVDIKTALRGAGVTATLTRPHPPQIDIDGARQIEYGPELTPGMLAIECSFGAAGSSDSDSWEFDVYLIAVKDGQARSKVYIPRYQEKDLLTMPGSFSPGDTLLAASTGGTAIYHLRVDGGDAILEATSGPYGQQYDVYDAKLSALAKALGDQFQKAAAAS